MATTKETQPQEPKDETEDAEAEEGTKKAPAAKRWFSRKLIAIVAAAIVGLGSAGGGAYYFLGSRSEAAPAGKIKPPVFFDMPDILVNLSFERQRSHPISESESGARIAR